METKFYYVKRLRLLEELRNRGHYPLATIPDVKNPVYSVWKYEATPEVMEIVDWYYNRRERKD